MSGDNLIDPLAPLITDELQLPLQPDFSSLVSDSLGNLADPTDGFDQVLADLIATVDSLEGGLVILGGAEGGNLDDTFLEILALDSDSPGLDVANLTAAIPDVQTNVDALGTLLVGASLPAPPQLGTGGMAVQTATGPVLACGATLGFGAGSGCSAFPCTAVVPFTNNSAVAQTISSVTLVQQPGGPWTVTTDAVPAFPAGATVHFVITATRAPQTGETAQVQVAVQGFANPVVLCLDAGSSGTVTGGGGAPPTGGGGTGGGLKLQQA